MGRLVKSWTVKIGDFKKSTLEINHGEIKVIF
jgi:hypothetical protein